ncbi:MAG TPA: trigger factor [Blastocatellia bacterium]|nr:trigger factor [Blastocatellia bacterium]
MNITVTDQENCKKQLRLEIPAETVRAERDKIAASLARQINIPGFRRGHVPPSVVKSRFKRELHDEMVSKLLPNALHEAITQKELKVLGEPKLDELKFGEDDSINVTVTVEVAPEFELAGYKGIPLKKRVYKVRDEDVDTTINRMREALAELKPVEDRGAQEGDIVTVNITGIRAPAAGAEGGEGAEATGPKELKQQDVKIELGGEGVLKQFTDGLTGARAGDVRAFSVEYPVDYGAEELAGSLVSYTAEVVGVHVKELPALDDEFARSVNEEIDSFEELRAKVRSNLEQEMEHRSEDELRAAAIDELIDRNRFAIPQQVLEKQIDTRINSFLRELKGQGLDPRLLKVDWRQIRESQRDRAERDIRLSFILDRIADNEKIEVSQEEIDRELERLASGTNLTVDALRARLTKEGTLDSIKEQVRSRKALDLVIASAEITTEEVEGTGGETATTGDEDGQAEG